VIVISPKGVYVSVVIVGTKIKARLTQSFDAPGAAGVAEAAGCAGVITGAASARFDSDAVEYVAGISPAPTGFEGAAVDTGFRV
jgi:hypothetical protein